MKKALIFQDQIYDIVNVGSEFPVSPELQWVDAPDDVSSQTHTVVSGVISLRAITENTALTYQELRRLAYPKIGDQLDAMWKGGEAEAAMLQTIVAVKAQFPKV